MRKWNEKNEDEKYALVITQDSDSSQVIECIVLFVVGSVCDV